MVESNPCWLFWCDSRSQHGMYEDIKPLFANSVLPLMAITLVDDVFQDYRSFKEIKVISPSVDGSLRHLQIKKDMLCVPFFQIVSADESTEKIHKAGSFSNETVDLGHCTRYKENIGIYDFQREALVKANSKFLRTKHDHWDTLTWLKIIVTQLLKGWNLAAITTQILSLAHMRLSWALWTE